MALFGNMDEGNNASAVGDLWSEDGVISGGKNYAGEENAES